MRSILTRLMDIATATNLFFYLPKSSLLLCFSSMLFLNNTAAQFTNNATLFRDDRGAIVHFLVQPAWQNNSVFNQQLGTMGYPTQRSFGLQLGVGASYLFKTGTAVGLEYALYATSKDANGNNTKLNQHLFLLSIKQYFVDLYKARLFVSVSGIGLEEHYVFSRQIPSPSTLQNAITTPNTTRFSRFADGIGGGIGITFKGEHGNTHRVTDFVELETGYRISIGSPFYTAGAADLPAIPGDNFRQYYIAIRGGLFVRKKVKEKKIH